LIEEKGKKLAEKLGTKWYNEGEKSTKYFMRLLNRRSPDVFKKIVKEDGAEVNGEEEIEREIVSFYKNLYENYEKFNVDSANNDENFFQGLESVNEGDDVEVAKPITEEELRDTLHSCKDSAPGLDGIPYSYIGGLWSIMGKLIVDAWNHSLQIRKLPPSHKASLLKLIPKAGKDLTKLTNWRPISLSNCDHKLITKVYSRRICDKVGAIIDDRQAAYLKGRLISDNVRAMVTSMRLANIEENVDGILVSLDAKKAFDSVEHSYIEKILVKFGLKSFVPIFKLLYSDLTSSIFINGRVVPGFKILRGVKQGDSLSCVLFIMCMEPLIRNIEANPEIEPIESTILGRLPKAYAYADDVNATIKRKRSCLQALFDEYARLSKWSRLMLNADKTEILPFRSNNVRLAAAENDFEVTYLNTSHRLSGKICVKINGLFFQQNEARMRKLNLEAVIQKVESQLLRWSMRSLSLLGKILVLKTFGISQVVYLMQNLVLEEADLKLLNRAMYKFLWNKKYLAAKAPERIKREIMNKSVTEGGFGMLDIVKLDDGLKLKALGRLLKSNHPYLKQLKSKLEMEDFFHPKAICEIDCVLNRGVELLKKDRTILLGSEQLESNRKLIALVQGTRITNIVSRQGKLSIPYFQLTQRGVRNVQQLTRDDLRRLERHILSKEMVRAIRKVIGLDAGNTEAGDNVLYPIKDNLVDLSSLTSKAIRQGRELSDPECVLKVGAIMTPTESMNYFKTLKSITSVKQKSLILKILHGDIYTKERQFRFKLVNDPRCDLCNETDTLEHRLTTCTAYSALVERTLGLTKSLSKLSGFRQTQDELVQLLGTHIDIDRVTLTLHAEVLSHIVYQKPRVPVDRLLDMILMRLIRNEKQANVKEDLRSLLSVLNRP